MNHAEQGLFRCRPCLNKHLHHAKIRSKARVKPGRFTEPGSAAKKIDVKTAVKEPRNYMHTRIGLRRTATLAISALFFFCLAFGVDTHVWQQDDQGEFGRATIKNLSIQERWAHHPGPVVPRACDPAIPYLWAVVEDSHGMLYCSGEHPPARHQDFRRDSQGK